MFIWFHFLLATCISASHSLVNLFLLSGSLNSFFLFLVLSVLKCVFYLSRCELMLFFLPFSYLYSLSPFSLAFNAEQFFSVILCTLPCIYSLCSLLDLLSDWYLNFSIYPLYFKNSFEPPSLYFVIAHYVLSLCFLNYHVHTDHLEISVKMKILV